jgi:hypothetical protein
MAGKSAKKAVGRTKSVAGSSQDSSDERDSLATWGELLRKALDWTLTDGMFVGVRRHGSWP